MRYGLHSGSIQGHRQFDTKLDRAITGLETEIGLKAADCRRLIEKLKENDAKIKQAGQALRAWLQPQSHLNK